MSFISHMQHPQLYTIKKKPGHAALMTLGDPDMV
jgi:hypothetical protein